jgi:hypothetical protein
MSLQNRCPLPSLFRFERGPYGGALEHALIKRAERWPSREFELRDLDPVLPTSARGAPETESDPFPPLGRLRIAPSVIDEHGGSIASRKLIITMVGQILFHGVRSEHSRCPVHTKVLDEQSHVRLALGTIAITLRLWN